MAQTAPAPRVYSNCDWLAFAITSFVVFVIYVVTLSTDINLESSGIYATAAMYAGVPCPPGYPHWTLIAWLFVHAFPLGNIAWRISLSSALEGALASGFIALMGCKAAAVVIHQSAPTLAERESRCIALVSGCVGAMAFAFSSDFWGMAVIVDVQAFNILLFTIVLVFAMRWIFEPAQKRFLYAAFFFYGFTITSGQSFISTSVGLQFLVAIGDRKFGRDLLLFNGCLLVVGWALNWVPQSNSHILDATPLVDVYDVVTVATILPALALVAMTRRAFTEWKPLLIACSLMALATLSYFLVPILSMTNPPVNWAYPRTVDGFFHALTRGQFERLNPSHPFKLVEQLKMYADVAAIDYGWYYLPFAVAPLVLLHRLGKSIRRWVVSLYVLFICTVILLIEVMNPSTDRQTLGLLKEYFSPSYVMLALLTATGLAVVISRIAKPPTPHELRVVSN